MSEMKKKCIKLAVGFSFDQNHPVLYENYGPEREETDRWISTIVELYIFNIYPLRMTRDM